MRYSMSYQERIKVKDGTELLLRAVQSTDKPLIEEGFHKLSAEARRLRFFSNKSELSEQELRYFTELDGGNHYAILALANFKNSNPEAVGIARFVRIIDQPVDDDSLSKAAAEKLLAESTVAEFAIVVADAWQYRGLGRAMLLHIVAAASERGIEEIRATALSENEQVRRLLEDLADSIAPGQENGTLEFSFAVPPPDKIGAVDELFEVLKLVALGTVVISTELGLSTLRRISMLGKSRDENEKP